LARGKNPGDSTTLAPFAESAQSAPSAGGDDTEAKSANPGAPNQNDPKPEPPGGSDLDDLEVMRRAAAKAERWDVVLALTAEIKEQRHALAGVVALDTRRSK
jgi:hypothetical protein